jgi:hypothetical protein
MQWRGGLDFKPVSRLSFSSHLEKKPLHVAGWGLNVCPARAHLMRTAGAARGLSPNLEGNQCLLSDQPWLIKKRCAVRTYISGWH